MEMKSILYLFVFLIMVSSSVATFYPSGDIDLQESYNISNAQAVYSGMYCYNNGTCFAIGTLVVQEGDVVLIDWLTVVITLGLVIIIWGMSQRDYTIAALGSIFWVVGGIFMIRSGIQNISNWTTDAFAIVLIAVGAYILLRGGYEIYKDM